MSGFLYATLRGLNSATPPTDLTLNRLALALRTTPALLSKTVMGYSENVRTKIINVVPSLGRGTVTAQIPEVVGGVEYKVNSAHDWQLGDSKIRVVVKFKSTGVNNPALSAWVSRIKSDWNVFKAVDKSATPPNIVATIPAADQFWVVNPFTFTNTSMMGNQKMDHAHSVQPRHVLDFAKLIQSSRRDT